MIAGIMAGAVFRPCCALGLNFRNCLLIAKMKFLDSKRYCYRGWKMQDLATIGEKTGYFSVQFAFSKHAQKPRKWLKYVVFSTFGLLKRAKKAKKIAFNYS